MNEITGTETPEAPYHVQFCVWEGTNHTDYNEPAPTVYSAIGAAVLAAETFRVEVIVVGPRSFQVYRSNDIGDEYSINVIPMFQGR